MNRIVLMATSFLLLGASSVLACSCMPGTPESYLENANAVFSGKVIDIIEQTPNSTVSSELPEAKRVIFEVSQVWKGKNKKQLVVTTAQSSAACGYYFQKGQRYLVYASGKSAKLQTGLCSGTKDLSEAQADLAVLGRGKAPVGR